MVASQVSCVNATIASVNVIPHNNCTAYNSAGTNNLCTFTPYTAGDTLIAACGNGDTVNSISGLKANSTSFSGPVAGIAGEDPTQIGFYPYIYYLANVPAVPTTISATTTAYDVTNCVVLDVTGMPPTAVTDGIAAVSESAYGNGALTNVTGSITTTHANDLILGFGIDNYVSFTPGTGYTMSTSTVVHAGAVEWQVVTSTGTFNPGIEWNGSGRIDAATVAFETN
jgi:hypothetical protein